MPEADEDEADEEADAVEDEAEPPFCGEARADVASTERKRVVDDRTECILVRTVVSFMEASYPRW